MGVTIKDVAKKSGVSVTTVSLVLNKKTNRISEKTRQLIEDAARELNYVPNHTAVSLATRRSRLIAVLLPAETYFRYDEFIQSMEYACKNAGYYLNIALAEHSPEDIRRQIRDMLRYNVEGIVIDPSALSTWSDDLQKWIDEQEIPIIFTASSGGSLPENAIVPNHRRAAEMAAGHLIELGHSRIGLITGPDNLTVTEEIISGYRSALEAHRVSFTEDLIYCGPYHVTTGKTGLRQLLDEHISALITISDGITYGAYSQLKHMHKNLPEDLSLVGYGKGFLLDQLELPITSVFLHLDRIARKSVNLIKQYNGSPAKPELIEPTLIERGSTGLYVPEN